MHEEKTARHLDRLSDALDSGAQAQVKKLLNSLNGAEIGDLLESLPQTKRQAVWELVKVDLDGDVLVEVNDEVRAGLIRDTSPDDLIQAMSDLEIDDLADILNDLPDAVITEVLRAMDRQDRDRLALATHLFGESRLSFETAQLFDATYAGRDVEWTGRVRKAVVADDDRLLGDGPFTKAVVEVASLENDLFGNTVVSAVVQLPSNAADRLLEGSTVTFAGTLVGIDALVRNVYVGKARLA